MLGHYSIAEPAKAVMTPLTEMQSTNLHDETTVCDQAQHTLFRAVVGKLQLHNQSETGSDVRDKMLVIQTWIAHTCRFDTCQRKC